MGRFLTFLKKIDGTDLYCRFPHKTSGQRNQQQYKKSKITNEK